MFCHLNVHSHYSPMRGIAPIEGIVDQARALDMTHMALTEVNGLWGFINFARIAQAFGCQGLKVEKPGELGVAIKNAFKASVPTVIDVTTSSSEPFIRG